MFALFRLVIIFLLVVNFPLPLLAGGTEANTRKPEGLKKTDITTCKNLTTRDRIKWKSVLNWCDECDERAKPFTQSNGGRNGGIFIYPIGDNQYIVDIKCYMTMQQSEHIYYKITEHENTIESRLLILEQFYHAEFNGGVVEGVKDPKGEFVRYTDSLTYGLTQIPKKGAPLLIVEKRYVGAGGCGIFTAYDVSDDFPEVIEFRARVFCGSNPLPPEQWKSYPPEQRAGWRVVPNPLREDWLSAPACSQ